uniref:Uncharacterized protein n=1 Tax=Siphoviridae sp. ctjOC2 TaxID=2825632 RepID=A0A8S5QAE1_9CAUD|nr:MAG TPA: hypothetical protein [Siphoviridae sp. ctjOC2]
MAHSSTSSTSWPWPAPGKTRVVLGVLSSKPSKVLRPPTSR